MQVPVGNKKRLSDLRATSSFYLPFLGLMASAIDVPTQGGASVAMMRFTFVQHILWGLFLGITGNNNGRRCRFVRTGFQATKTLHDVDALSATKSSSRTTRNIIILFAYLGLMAVQRYLPSGA